MVAGIAAGTIAGPARIASAQTGEAMTIRVDFLPWGVQAALHLALSKGWLKDAGLNVDLQDGTGTLNTINLVGAGRVDVGLVQLGPMAIARGNGLPVKSFAGYLRKGDLAVLVDAAKGPKTPKDLVGKKIVCFAASPWAPFIDSYLKRHGLEKGEGPGKVNVVMVSPQAMVSTYATGDADGFMSLKQFGEPLVAKTRAARSFLAADVGIAFPSYGLIATDDTIAKRGPALRKLAETQARAWTYIHQADANAREAAQALIANRPNMQLNLDVIKAQLDGCKEFFETPATKGRPLGWQATEDWKAAVASMSEVGLVKADAKLEDYFTNALLPA